MDLRGLGIDDSLLYEVWTLQVASYAFWTGKCSEHIPAIYQLGPKGLPR